MELIQNNTAYQGIGNIEEYSNQDNLVQTAIIGIIRHRLRQSLQIFGHSRSISGHLGQYNGHSRQVEGIGLVGIELDG